MLYWVNIFTFSCLMKWETLSFVWPRWPFIRQFHQGLVFGWKWWGFSLSWNLFITGIFNWVHNSRDSALEIIIILGMLNGKKIENVVVSISPCNISNPWLWKTVAENTAEDVCVCHILFCWSLETYSFAYQSNRNRLCIR